MKTAIQKTIISDTAIFTARTVHDRHFDSNWHAHPEYQLFLVLEGEGTRFIGDTVSSFKEGDLTFLGPNIPHLWRDEDPIDKNQPIKNSKGIVIYFNESSLGNLIEKEELRYLKILLNKIHRGIEIHGSCREEIKILMSEIIKLHGIESLIHLLKIFDKLTRTKEYKLLHNDVYSYKLKKAETDRINIVFNYVVENFKRKITLKEVARLLNMTPTSFSRYFTKNTSKNFSYFLSELRIKHACKILTSKENINISEVCYESGFNTLSNFNKQFKAYTQLTPKEFKTKYWSSNY